MAPEVRVDWSKGEASFDGYAAVYDVWYRVGGKWGWDEMVVSGAAADNVRDDVRLLVNHEGVPMARTAAGTMTLESDRTGLRARAPKLDLRNPTVQELVSAAERGDLAEMSFAFRPDPDRDTWNGDFTERRIGGFEAIVDVAAVSFPASPSTSFKVRGAAMSLSLARMLADDLDLDDVDGRARVAASLSRMKVLVPMNAVEARVRRVTA
ncbi:MAG: HK97 family phage prohead protease [Acidimicrobiales bacterium]